jgi:hypothetical protein
MKVVQKELHRAHSTDSLGQSVSHLGETKAVTDVSDSETEAMNSEHYFLTYVSIYS